MFFRDHVKAIIFILGYIGNWFLKQKSFTMSTIAGHVAIS